jgi:hypothetical protein
MDLRKRYTTIPQEMESEHVSPAKDEAVEITYYPAAPV